MKKTLVFCTVFFSAVSLFAATIEQLIIRQQWPWSAGIKIEYRISGVDAPVNITVSAANGQTPLDADLVMSAVSGDISGVAEDRIGTIHLDPVKLFGSAAVSLADFRVKLTPTAAPDNINEILYKIVDLDTGAVQDVTRADFYNGRCGAYETAYSKIKDNFSTTLDDVLIWTDVTNRTEFMTSKMVFRKIPAKDIVWQMGETDPDVNVRSQNEPFWAALDADYFIGVFQVTQAQFDKFRHDDKAGHWGNYFTNETNYPDHLIYPVAGMSMGDTIRNGQAYTYLERMKAKCKLEVNLPTEAQWEFACRGGNYAKALYSGRDYTSGALQELAWCQDNADSKMHPVNTKYPNAYGLYGMQGNAGEYCFNRIFTYPTETTQENPVVNPGSDVTTGNFVYRGGTYKASRVNMVSSYRHFPGGGELWKDYGVIGFRVCFPAP